MNKLLKNRIIILLLITLVILTSACGKKTDPTVVYTNLIGDKQEQLLVKIFDDAKITETKDFFIRLHAFNDIQPKEAGLVAEFTQLKELDYNREIISSTFNKKYKNTYDINCRLTAFDLIKKYIKTSGGSAYGNYLMFDLDILETNKTYKAMFERKNDYIALFDEISVANLEDKDLDGAYPKALKERGVEYLNDKVKIISIVLNDPYEKKLFVGHAGLLFYYDNYYWFLEKISPLDPYQLTRFQTKEDLYKELRTRKHFQEAGAHPFIILENDHLLKQ